MDSIGNPHSYLYTANGSQMKDKNLSVLFLNLLQSRVKWKFYAAKMMFVLALCL